MDIEKFAGQIRKMNQNDLNKVILAFIGFLGFDFCMITLSACNGLWFLVIGQVIEVIISLEVGRYQWNRYLYVSEERLDFGMRYSLNEVVRMQSFPTNEYFNYVNKKMLGLAVWIGICSTLMGILAAEVEENVFALGRFFVILCFSVVNAMCPFLAGIWKKKFWIYQSRMGNKGKLNLVYPVCKTMFTVVEVLFLVCVIPIAVMILWGCVIGVFEPYIDETIVVVRSYPYEYSFILAILAVVAVLFAIVLRHPVKKISKAAVVAAGVFCVATVIVLVIELHTYTEFAKNEITVCRLWNTKTYKIENVERFLIYDENNSIQMKIYLDDGNFTKVSGAGQSCSELYEKLYYSDYNFLADYIEKLQKAGVAGKMKDEKKLREDVNGLAPQVKSGFEKIMTLMK